jgi:hypothetical protein
MPYGIAYRRVHGLFTSELFRNPFAVCCFIGKPHEFRRKNHVLLQAVPVVRFSFSFLSLRIQGLGLNAEDLGSGVLSESLKNCAESTTFRSGPSLVQGLGFGVECLALRVQSFGFRNYGFVRAVDA